MQFILAPPFDKIWFACASINLHEEQENELKDANHSKCMKNMNTSTNEVKELTKA